MSDPPLRVAVVGAGPSGVFTAAALTAAPELPVEVTVVDRLPTPFGLVRYGVAPDHFPIRQMSRTLEKLLDRPEVAFLGNVEIGSDVTAADLRRCFHAVVWAVGAPVDRALGVPGEELPGNLAAAQLVSWYCGHPDADRAGVEGLLATAKRVAVVGVGNVALDVARVLIRPPDVLDTTDMPQHVLDALRDSPVREVHLIGRRGPAQASFTAKELRDLGAIDGIALVVDPADLPPDDSGADANGRRNLATLREWADRPRREGLPELCLRFWRRPVRIEGTRAVEALVTERTQAGPDGTVHGTGRFETLPVDLVVRSVGHASVAVPGVPFDPVRRLIPTEGGRVVGAGAGDYAVGWAKRGPSGVIGTNKADGQQTAAAIREDAPALLRARPEGVSGLASLRALLAARGSPVVDLSGWRRIDQAEIALGRTRGRARTSLHRRDALLDAAVHSRQPG